MARYRGIIGFVWDSKETRPGIWESDIVEKKYTGNSLKISKRFESGDKVNEDIVLNNQISIVADAYANQNFYAIRYVQCMGAFWKVTGVEVQRPRLILTIGGVYNGPRATTTGS